MHLVAFSEMQKPDIRNETKEKWILGWLISEFEKKSAIASKEIPL